MVKFITTALGLFGSSFTNGQVDFSNYGLGVVKPDVLPKLAAYNPKARAANSLPDTFDPRTGHACSDTITTIHNQGGCGSCWAFSAAYVLNDAMCFGGGHSSIWHSEQHLGSCSSDNDLCNGGWPASAMHWAVNGEGTVTRDCQAYQEQENCFSSCDAGSNTNFEADKRYNQFPDTTQVVGINPDQIGDIKDFMMNHGSMVIAMFAEGAFFSYSGGVYTSQVQGSGVNHALVCVGWEGNNWICKNSWGAGFGENGFIRFPIGQGVLNEMEAQWTGMQFLECEHGFDAHANCDDPNEDSYNGGSCDVIPTGCGAGVPSDSVAPADIKEEGNPFEMVQYSFEEAEAIILEQMGYDSNLRVVNGDPVTNFDDAPFYARILQCHNGNSVCYICGASWISSNELITAAHCVDGNMNGEKPQNTLYVYTWESGGMFGTSWASYSVSNSEFKIHPNWDGDVNNGHDIAIVPVAGANMQKVVQLAKLSEYNQLNRCDFFTVFGTGTTNTGEGASNQLLKSDVLQYIDCYSSDMWSYEWYNNGIYQYTGNFRPNFDHAVCTNSTVEYQTNGVDGLSAICQGDSGGPLIHKDKLFGIVSYNYLPCNSGKPNGFTSVAHFVESGWIQANSNYNANGDFWCKEDCNHHSHCEEDGFEIDTTIAPNPTTQSDDGDDDGNDGGDSGGSIESEHPYRASRDDNWTITPPAGKKVKMSFSSFQTETYWDGVAIICDDYTYAFSGNNDHVPAGAIAKLQGENSNNIYFHSVYGQNYQDSKTWSACKDSSVQVRFLSDNLNEDYGFKLDWEYVDSCDGDDNDDNDDNDGNDDNDDNSCCEFGDLCISLDKHNELRSLHSDTENF